MCVWGGVFLLSFLASPCGALDSESSRAGGRASAASESARRLPCDQMTHLCPNGPANHFLPECGLSGRVGRAARGSSGKLRPFSSLLLISQSVVQVVAHPLRSRDSRELERKGRGLGLVARWLSLQQDEDLCAGAQARVSPQPHRPRASFCASVLADGPGALKPSLPAWRTTPGSLHRAVSSRAGPF